MSPDSMESRLARIDERTADILNKVDVLAHRMIEDHDTLVKIEVRFADHCDDHRKRESLFQWKVGLLVLLASSAVGLLIKLIHFKN